MTDTPEGVEKVSLKALCNFQEKQMMAHEAMKRYDYVLYGGAAGGGKSYFMRWEAIALMMKWYLVNGLRGVRGGIFCEDYPSLNDRHLSKIKFEFPDWLGSYNGAAKEFTLNDAYGGGVICFRNLDDPSKYVSSEFAFIFVDELTKNVKATFDFLISRMRWVGIEDSKFLGCTNPGEVGHGWVKKLWINRDFTGENYDANDFHFVPAKFTDNKYLPKSYEKKLDGLPEEMRRAYRDGDWDMFKGQFFTEFRRELHVIDPWMDGPTITWFNQFPTFAGMDYGYSKPSCILWGKYIDDCWYIFDEYYATEKTFEELAEIIKSVRIPEVLYADPSIWAKKDSPTSGAEKMNRRVLDLRLKPAFNERVMGWNMMHQLLKENKIKMFSNCRNLIRTLPDLVYDETKTEDLDTDGEDHAIDALRYLCFTHKRVRDQKQPMSYAVQGRQIQIQSDLDEVFNKEEGINFLPTYG